MSVYLGRHSEPLIGVYGDDPREHASVELGRRGVRLIVKGMAAKAKALTAEADGQR